LGEHCSSTERKADEATRDALDWLKCEYMQDKVGETFNGIITSVNSFGVFIELDEIYVDGLVHISALHNDYYHYDPVGHRLTGERTGKVLRLGDPLTIVVAKVNLDDRKIDFVPAEGVAYGTSKKRKSRRTQKSIPGKSKSEKSKRADRDKATDKVKKPNKKKGRKKRSKTRAKN
jgi:ribonuclease R